MIATLIGVVVGGVGALYIDRQQEIHQKHRRAKIILHNIYGEREKLLHQHDCLGNGHNRRGSSGHHRV